MILSLGLLYAESFSFTELKNTINQQILNNRMDSIKTGIPAILYTIQTNLVYLAISNLDAAVFQVTFQLKILTTAIFTVFLLNRSLRVLQWFSLIVLTLGISIIQIQNVKVSNDDGEHKNALFGLFCVIMACVLSGLAGVYFEKILKNSKVSIWVRNIQLGLFGTFFALLTVYASDYENVQAKGFFFGYNNLVWINIMVQSAGGLLVAVVIKYADNILKGFATSISIILSCLASVILFDTIINLVFAVGTFLVVLAVVLYSYTPAQSQLPTSDQNASSLSDSRSTSPKSIHSNESSLLYAKDDSELIKYSLINNGNSNSNKNTTIEMSANLSK